jgi:type I site-specific restriction endonuclease
MLNTVNVSSPCSPFTLTAYNEAHRADVRDLAEMFDAATSGTTATIHLTDPEDSRSAVFNECVSLYAAKHNISEAELAEALRDWHRIETIDDAQAAYLVEALGNLDDVERDAPAFFSKHAAEAN